MHHAPDTPGWRALRHLDLPEPAAAIYGRGGLRLLAEQSDTIDALWALERFGGVHPGERRRILNGDYTAIQRAAEPALEPGYREVLSWSRPHRSYDVDSDTTVEIPSQPLLEITVTAKTRRTDGTWRISYDVDDRRQQARLVRRKPPVYDPDLMREDQGHQVNGAEEQEARLEGNYTTNRIAAVDELEAVDDEELRRQRKQADDTWAALRTREQQRAKVKAVAQRIRRVEGIAANNGIDPAPLLEEIETRLEHFERQIEVEA
jgi:hypothetical protein